MNIKELKRFLEWRIKHDAINSAEAAKMLGITRPNLIAMREAEKIKGRQFDGEWWYPKSEVEKNLIAPGTIRRGRPRSRQAV